IDLHPDEFGGNLGGAVGASFRKPILEGDGAAFDPAEFAQAVHQGGKPLAVGRARAWYEHADERLFRRLLRARRERPRGGCAAAEQRDERAPFQLIELHSVPSQGRIAEYRGAGAVRNQPSGGRTTQNSTPLFWPSCGGAQT